MTILKEKTAKRGRILLVFGHFACWRKHLYGLKDGECHVFLEKEIFGISEDEEILLTWKNGIYRIGHEELSDSGPYYYDTKHKERLLMFLSNEQTTLETCERLLLKRDEVMKIGNAYQNQIFYDCYALAKPQLAEIFWKEEGYVICPKVAEGIYVNERAIKEEERLRTGDRIDIYGLHLMVLSEILICCCFTGTWRIAGGEADLRQAASRQFKEVRALWEGCGEWIERYCGMEESLHEGELEILLPEAVNKEKSVPLFLSLGPSLTMVLPMLLMAWAGSRMTQQAGGNFYLLSLVMSVSSAFLAFFWGLVNHGYRKYVRRQEEKGRTGQYLEYLERTRTYLMECAKDNQRSLEHRYPMAKTYFRMDAQPAMVAWNRYYRQPDFLFLRLGTGTLEFQMQVKAAGGQKKIILDKLSEKADNIVHEFELLKEAPVGIDFWQIRQLGFLGEGTDEQLFGVLYQVLIQLAACHCYTEVKLVCFYQKERESHRKLAECMKWMRHSWSADGKTRFLAGDEREAAQIIPKLLQELEKGADKKELVIPWYLFLILDEKLIQGEVLYQYLLDPDGSYPVSTIFVKRLKEELPRSCKQYIRIQEKEQEMVTYGETQIIRKPICLERVHGADAISYLREISGFKVRKTGAEMQLPESVSFLQLYKCTRVEELSSTVRWKRANIRERLKVPIGASASGNLVWLDVHEKFHGPHGLIAGTTGSGKSELLQTYLLSLAVNYSPEDVNFFMIDYKGGGTGNLLQDLPHCAGVISNLSGKQIKRAMSAIISENKRRQQQLSSLLVNHIDAYTELYKEGKARVPMPHLLLVVDEFAELRKEEPEFMQDIISLAQVGRSLGVHLILATQKPAGTVDDRIWSNARFRLCLRVQDRQDSLDMLHNGDAAMITIPGRCYLQIGNQEYYELFQAGYCGGEYSERTNEGSGAVLVESTGVRKQRKERDHQKSKQTQLEAVVNYVNQISDQEKYKRAKKLWMPELPETIYLEEVEEIEKGDSLSREDKEKEIKLLIGLCDDPENQMQFSLFYCPREQGHLAVCGGPMTGKTSMLQTVLWQLCTRYMPEKAVVLIIDGGQESLGCFAAMPGCIGTMRSEKEKDIFFYHLKRLLTARKKQLSGISIEQYNRGGKGHMPCVFLVIDSFGAFFQHLSEKQQEFFIHLAAEGINSGIYLILSALAPGEIPGKLYEKIKTTLALEMSDRFAYGDILRQYYIPVLPKENTRGRGLCKVQGRILEFQTALAVRETDDYSRMSRIKSTGKELNEEWKKSHKTGAEEILLKPFPQIPDTPDYELLKNTYQWKGKSVPLGYSLTSGEITELDIHSNCCFLVAGAERTGMETVLSHIAEGMLHQKETVLLIDPGEKIKDFSERENVQYFTQRQEILQLFREIKPESNILITDIADFCRSIYSADELYLERITFWEEIVEGKKKKIFLAGGYTLSRDFETEGTEFFRRLAKWQSGIHLGGNGAGQRIFDFADLGYTRLNQYEPVGVGYYKKGPGSRTERILIPGMGAQSNDNG